MTSIPTIFAEAEPSNGMEYCPEWLLKFFDLLQGVADIAGMTAITVGLLGGIWIWLSGEARSLRGRSEKRWMSIRRSRLFLGSYILLGLELMIVSDLVHSFLHPNLESLYVLGLVVLIRTAISFFLGKELEAVRDEEAESTT
ncbi:MAG: DUF1622 domain-containing protein [Verrucomicrobiota bacterium]